MNWDLSKLYQGFDDLQLNADVEAFHALAAQMRAAIAALDEGDAAGVDNAIRLAQQMTDLQIKVGNFTFLTLAVDANNEAAQAFHSRTVEMDVEYAQLYSALCRFLAGVKDWDAFVNASELTRQHAFFLNSLRDDARHTIDPALEPTVLELQKTGGKAWEQLRDQLDANLMIDIELDGEKKTMPLSAIRGLAYSDSAEVRRKAYDAEIAAYPRIEISMAACLNGIKGEAHALARLRGYDTVLDTALNAARMDRETLDALLGAMEESLPMFRRYFRLKAKMLGYEGGLKFCDLFAPVGGSSRRYTLEEARRLLVDVMGKFSDNMAKFIDNAFEDRWIDVYPREGKTGGAFCSGVHPLKMSYIMANFEGSFSSVSTLAHELGHAYHNSRMNDGSVLMSDYPMPLAETASIFNETLLAEKILEDADAATRMTLLEQQLGDAAQVVVDIMSRYLFETEVVERRKERTLSARELCGIMLDAQRKTYGDGLAEDCMHPYMWACKSHYYSTGIHFYNFPYAFGMLFGYGVYAQYQQKGAAFVEEYDQLLTATGSGNVRDVAASIGIDVTDRAFWRASLDILAGKLDQLAAGAEDLAQQC